MTDTTLLERIRVPQETTEINRAFNHKTVKAIGTVVAYTISDAFDLVPEEVMWTRWHLDEILEILEGECPSGVQVAVKQELDNYVYSAALSERDRVAGKVHQPSENIKYASKDDWTEALTEIIFASYPDLRPMTHSRIVGSISGLLEEIGLTNNGNSRASLYLPNVLRYIVANK